MAVDVLVFLGALAVATAVGAVVAYGFDLWYGDSLSRTADAYMALYSRDTHAGAIGFVWPPLPTTLRVLLLPLTRPLGLAAFTGPLTSALFAAGCVLLLNRILRELDLEAHARTVWVLAAFANPVVLLHFTNGTAESALTCFILLTIYCFLHIERAPTTAVLGMGTACALALLTRYEALALAGMAALALVLREWASHERLPARESSLRLEAQLTALLAPVAFAGMLWLFANWTIQGDALFFFRSVHGARGAFEFARNVPDHPLAFAYGSLLGTARHVLERTLQLSIVFPLGAVAVAVLAITRRDVRAAGVLLLAISTMLIQAYQAYTGGIHPWLRTGSTCRRSRSCCSPARAADLVVGASGGCGTRPLTSRQCLRCSLSGPSSRRLRSPRRRWRPTSVSPVTPSPAARRRPTPCAQRSTMARRCATSRRTCALRAGSSPST
ncbi:MAG: hypothetical protein EXR63_03635 [Dehalococcoidia bacterium]|nr:hypothetical protein [Dehalococcoidia bacterium]